MMSSPKRTLYLNNLNDKAKPRVVKELLYALFSQYGQVLEIVNKKTPELRGQAWIIYTDLESAVTAQRQLNGTVFLGKPMNVMYAAEESHIIAKFEGTFDPREAKAKKIRKLKEDSKPEIDNNNNITEQKVQEDEGATQPMDTSGDEIEENGVLTGSKIGEANRILLLENLPSDFTETDVESIVKSKEGFVAASMVPSRPGIAFVEFEDELCSSSALKATEGLKLPNQMLLRVSFAKK